MRFIVGGAIVVAAVIGAALPGAEPQPLPTVAVEGEAPSLEHWSTGAHSEFERPPTRQAARPVPPASFR